MIAALKDLMERKGEDGMVLDIIEKYKLGLKTSWELKGHISTMNTFMIQFPTIGPTKR